MNPTRTRYQFSWLPYLAVILAALPLMIGRDFTPDNELRYLSIADEALANGQFMAFTNHGLPYADKPPLYIWIVMACRLIAGAHCMWLLSLFSLVPALICCAVMQRWVRLKARWSEAAAWMLLTGAYFFGLSVTLRMDMLMTLFIVLALRSFWIMYREPSRVRQRWLFPLWVFLAVFSKGPLGILIPLAGSAAFLLWQKELKSFGRFWGWRTWLVLLVLCGAWFGGVALDGGAAYLDNLLVHQTVGRAVNAFHHKRPFWYYCVAFWYSMAPWSLAVIAAVIVAAIRKKLSGPLDRLLLSVSAVTFVMLSCFSSKIQVYLLPIFPFLAFLGARLMQDSKGNRLPVRLCLAIPALAFVFAPMAVDLIGAKVLPASAFSAAWRASFILMIGGLWALSKMFLRGRDVEAAIRSIGLALMGAVFVAGLSIGSLNSLLGYRTAAEAAKPYITENSMVYTFGMPRSENMDAYLGRPVVFADTINFRPGPGDVVIRRNQADNSYKIEIFRK